MKTAKFYLILGITFLIFPMWAQDSPEKKLTGFSHPESVVYDEDRDMFYVSNIGDKEPGDGFISLLSGDGEVLNARWITGLHDPKGLMIQGNSLFVTDNIELVEMDILEGEILERKMVVDAESLNDIAADDVGNLYISDIQKNSIFMVDRLGEVTEWLNNPDLEQPNGLFVTDDAIFVAAWGKDNPGNLLKVNRDTKEIETVTRAPIGNLDGIQPIDSETFYISDWATGKIYKINKSGEQSEVLTSAKSAGDILYYKKENKLVLPMNHQNEVWWYSVE